MTAQIIEFPMDRVRKPVTQRAVRSIQPYRNEVQIRLSVKIARLVILSGLVFGALFLVFLSVSSGLSPAQANSETNTSTKANFAYVTVMSGETLWTLAERYSTNQDPRDFIANLVALNNLENTDLTPGMQLALPLN